MTVRGTNFSGFTYTDASNAVNRIKIQYKAGTDKNFGHEQTVNKPFVNPIMPSPILSDVTQCQFSTDGGTTWTTGPQKSEPNFITSVDGDTNTTGNNTITENT